MYPTVSVGQKFRSSLAGQFRLRVSHKGSGICWSCSHLEVRPSMKACVLGAGRYLIFSPHGLLQRAVWVSPWQKKDVKKQKWELQCFWWPFLKNHTTSLPQCLMCYTDQSWFNLGKDYTKAWKLLGVIFNPGYYILLLSYMSPLYSIAGFRNHQWGHLYPCQHEDGGKKKKKQRKLHVRDLGARASNCEFSLAR